MHSLWDSGMIERIGESEEFWLANLASLDTQENRDAACKGTVEDWATEHCSPLGKPTTCRRLGRPKPGQKLADAYLNANLPVAHRRIYLAGVRLAIVLNEAFLSKKKPLRLGRRI